MAVLAIYAAFTADTTGVDLEAVAQTQEQLASPHWLLSAFLHVPFNVAITVSIMAISGATEKNQPGDVFSMWQILWGPIYQC